MVYLTFAFLTMTLSILFCTFNKSYNHRQRKIMWLGFVIILAFLCSMIEPKPIYDLYRYYIDLDSIRGQVGLKEFVFGDVIVTDSNYRYTFTHNFITYIISSCMPKEALPFLAISFCYGCMAYIFEDIYKDEKVCNWKVAMTILFSITTLPLLYVYSNIRTAMAMSCMALTLYMRIYRKMNIVYFFIMALLAATIHPVALAVVPFILVSKISLSKKGVLLIGVVPLFTNHIMAFFQYSDNPYLRYIGIKYFNYVFVEVYSQGNFFYYSPLLITIAILALGLLMTNKVKIEDLKMKNLIMWYCIFVLASAQSFQLLLRLPFLFGVLSPIILKNMICISNYKGWRKTFYICIFLSMLGLSLIAITNNFLWLG